MKTYFKQPCPVCGRPLYVPVDLLGRDASCSHCSGVFTANDCDDESLSGMKFDTIELPMTMRRVDRQELNRHRLQRADC
jgi:hypothetical protein